MIEQETASAHHSQSSRDLAATLFLDEHSKKSKFTKKMAQFDPDGMCVVCLDAMGADVDERVRKLSNCKHVFHDHCIMKWVKRNLPNPKCPHCS